MKFVSDTLELERGSVRYFVAGEGADVVYLHPASGIRFTAPIMHLAENFRVWMPIIPGFDGTETIPGIETLPEVAELFSMFVAETSGSCDVVGQSLGGWLGAWLAVLHPEQIGQLVLSAPAGFRPADAPPLSFEPEVFQAQLYAHPERRPADDKPPEIVAANQNAVRHYGLSRSRDEELIARLSKISCLTLILQGTEDVRVPTEAVQMLRYEIKHSHLVYIYDAAHSLEVDQPDKVGEVIVDFLTRSEAFIVKPGRNAPEFGAST